MPAGSSRARLSAMRIRSGRFAERPSARRAVEENDDLKLQIPTVEETSS
jgi:hypothetical protein